MSPGRALGLGMHLFRAAVRECEKVDDGRGILPVGGKTCEKSSQRYKKVHIPFAPLPSHTPSRWESLGRKVKARASEKVSLLAELPFYKPVRRSRLRRTGRRSLGKGRRGIRCQYGSRASPVKASFRAVKTDRRCTKALSFRAGKYPGTCGLHDFSRSYERGRIILTRLEGLAGSNCPTKYVNVHQLPVDANRHTKRRWWFAHHVSKYMPRLVKDRDDPRRLRVSLLFLRKFRKGAWLEYKSRFGLLDQTDNLVRRPDRLGKMKSILIRKPVRYEKRKQSRSGALVFTRYHSLVAQSPKRVVGRDSCVPSRLVIDPKVIATLWSPFDLTRRQLTWVSQYWIGGRRATTLSGGVK
jgi:hypothetical protein